MDIPADVESVLDLVLTRAMKEELSKDSDEQSALRKALLLLVFLVQDKTSPALKDFLDYLLLQFPPLSASFVEHRQPFIGDHAIMRGRDENHLRLLLEETFVTQLVREFREKW